MKEWWDTVRYWLPQIVKQRAFVEQDWLLNRRRRWWYTAKAVLCLLSNRDEYRGHAPKERWPQKIEVAYGPVSRWSHPECGDAADWDYFAVGCGVVRNWWFGIGSEGYP